MKNLMIIAGLVGFLFLGTAYKNIPTTSEPPAATLEWMDWETAMQKMDAEPKYLLVDVYTDWCGWCKVMDKQTFTDPKVIEYLNKHFYAVKLDAEQKESITFDGNEFKWVEGGRRGIHQLAYSLLDGNLGYPSIVYLTPKVERVMISPGFKKPDALLTELSYVADEKFRELSLDEYKKTAGK